MNIYIAKIQEISNQSKYTRWYIQIVTKGLQRASSKKFEKLKNIRYVGQTGKAALEFKHKYNNTQL